MFRTTHRLFSSLRSSARVGLNAAAGSPRAALTRRMRMMSSESHAGHGSTSNDRPWIVGSALVFGPLFLYLLSPSARSSSHGHTDHGRKGHHEDHVDSHAQHVESRRELDVKPIADDEGTEISSQEVKESMEKAFEVDSPKDAQEREEVVAKTESPAVEENSAVESHPQAGLSTDAMPTQSQPDSTPAAPVGVDGATNATSEEEGQGNTSNTNEPTAESKA